jgi:dTDP-glucose pyrophosphorylase
MGVTLILPVCGDSTRFGGRPKFLLTHPAGKCMLRASIDGLNLSNVDRIVTVVREDHAEQYKFMLGLTDQMSNLVKHSQIITTQRTKSQPDTVTTAIKAANIEGPIAIKDCDNFFQSSVPEGNFVATSNLQDHSLINPSNKSYVVGRTDDIDHIVEKKVIGNTFACGLYTFSSAESFVKCYEHMVDQIGNPIYISDIVRCLLNNGINFQKLPVKHYVDWGTREDWERYLGEFETIFIDLDGVLVENSSQFMEPKWGTTKGITDNIRYLKERRDSGKVFIVITTSRAMSWAQRTMDQLNALDIPWDEIIYDLPHSSRRVIINDYAHSNPYPSCYAINLPRNTEMLRELMR